MKFQKINRLTSRETEVLKLLSLEYSSKEIAKGLHVSQPTIETHRRNLLMKMQVKNVAGLIRKSFEVGILTVDNIHPTSSVDLPMTG